LRNKIIGGSDGKIRISFNNTSGRTIWMVSITYFYFYSLRVRGRVMVFNVTFNNISVISWRSVLLLEETGVPGKNH
jgi:hypothetical protein